MKAALIIISCYALVYSSCVYFGQQLEYWPNSHAPDGASWIIVSPAPEHSCYQEPQSHIAVHPEAEFTLASADRQSRTSFPAQFCAKCSAASPRAAVE
jgi:hypothetical protein